MEEAYEGCLSSKTRSPICRARHSIEATFGAAMPIEKRHSHSRLSSPDADPPVVRGSPENRRESLFVTASRRNFTTSTARQRAACCQDYAPGSSQLLQYLISQAKIPEYHGGVRFREAERCGVWDNPRTQHYAVWTTPHGPRKMELRRHQGRCTF